MLQYNTNTILPAASNDSDERLSPTDVISFWRRYTALIIGCVTASLVVGGLYILTAPANFVASSQVIIESRRPSWAGASPDMSMAQYSLDSSQIESQIQIIKSDQTSRQVVTALKLDEDPEFVRTEPTVFSSLHALILGAGSTTTKTNDLQMTSIRALADRLQVRRIGQSYVLEISYWSRDANKAARICNSITAAYISDLLKAKIDAAQGGSEILERRISVLRDQRKAAEHVVLTGIFENETFPTADARIISVATPPFGQSWPRVSLVLAFSGVFGLFVALLSAAIHRSLDTSIRSRRQIEHQLGLRLLGALPRTWFRARRSLLQEVVRRPMSSYGRAIRQITTSVRLEQTDTALICIGVTSTVSCEDRSTFAANLAWALSANGSPTLLINADVDDPLLCEIMPNRVDAGLFDLLQGTALPEDVLVRGHANDPDFISPFGSSGSSLRRIARQVGIAAYEPRARPHKRPVASADLLGSTKMQDFLHGCRQFYVTVLIVLPALEESPDARALSPHLDAVLFVAEYGRIPVDRIATSVRSLHSLDVKFLGAVVNKAPRSAHF